MKALKLSLYISNLIINGRIRRYCIKISRYIVLVKFFNESKGYGFITNDETGEDLFVHYSALGNQTIKEGDKVEYEEGEGRKGKAATNVSLI